MASTPLRSVRIPDNIWYAARDRAEAEGTSVSKIILIGLQNYSGENK